MEELFPVQVDHGIDLNAIREEEEKEEEKEKRKSSSIFVPVLPLFDKKHRGSGVVPLDYMKPYLEEQTRSMVERFQELDKVFSSFLIGLRNSHNIFLLMLIFSDEGISIGWKTDHGLRGALVGCHSASQAHCQCPSRGPSIYLCI